MKRDWNAWISPIEGSSLNAIVTDGTVLFGQAAAILLACLSFAALAVLAFSNTNFFLDVPSLFSMFFTYLTLFIVITAFCAAIGTFLTVGSYCILRPFRSRLSYVGAVLLSIVATLALTYFPLGMFIVQNDSDWLSDWLPAAILFVLCVLSGRMGGKIQEAFQRYPIP